MLILHDTLYNYNYKYKYNYMYTIKIHAHTHVYRTHTLPHIHDCIIYCTYISV